MPSLFFLAWVSDLSYRDSRQGVPHPPILGEVSGKLLFLQVLASAVRGKLLIEIRGDTGIGVTPQKLRSAVCGMLLKIGSADGAGSAGCKSWGGRRTAGRRRWMLRGLWAKQ